MRPFDDLDGLAAARMPAKPSTERPAGATQAPKAIDGTRSDKREDERRRADQQAQAEQAEAAGQGGGVQYTGGKADFKDARDKQMEAALKAKEGDDGMDELARARQAAAQEIDARNAQAAMDQRSRAGLGGLGLSGAASAAEGDLARQQARTKILTMQEFDQAAEDAKFTDIQRRAALDDLEDAADIDYDGDGLIAGQTEGDRKRDQELQSVIPDEADEYVAGNKASAEEITAAEFRLLPAGGTATPEADGYLYIITNETPRRFLKVKASAIGAGRSD
jgi:hypothetical protein